MKAKENDITIQSGSAVLISWKGENYQQECKFLKKERGFFVLQDKEGNKVTCRPSHVDIKIINENR